jgi:hypothetical protein
MVTFSNLQSGSNCGSNMGPIRHSAGFFPIYDVVVAIDKWLSLVERTLGVGEVASSNLVVPTINSIVFNRLARQFRVRLAKTTV